jgi:hypothetical protein
MDNQIIVAIAMLKNPNFIYLNQKMREEEINRYKQLFIEGIEFLESQQKQQVKKTKTKKD